MSSDTTITRAKRSSRPTNTVNQERFERFYLEGLLARETMLFLDMQEKVLSLVQDTTLIEQVAFYKGYPHQTVRGCQLFQLFCQTYPRILTLRELREWYRENAALDIVQRQGRDLLWDDIGGVRAIMKPLGIALVCTPEVGYRLYPALRPATQEKFMQFPSEGILPPYQRLTFNTEARILTLLSGKALLEQVLFYEKEAELFTVLAQAYPEPCLYETLLAWQHGVQLATAQRWYHEAKKNGTDAFHELTSALKMNILRLKQRLSGFGITIQSFRGFGYTLAPLRLAPSRRKTKEMR